MKFLLLYRLPFARSFFWHAPTYYLMHLLRQHDINHIEQPLLLTTCLILIFAGILLTNQDMRTHISDGLKGKKWLWIVLTYCLLFSVYFLFTVDTNTLKEHGNVHFAYLSPIYILTKSVDIGIQQLSFAMFGRDLLNRGFTIPQLRPIGIIILTAIHLLTLFTLPINIAIVFIIASGFAGLIFPDAMFNKKYGFAVSYSIHWLFYLFMGLTFNFYLGNFV